MTKHTPGPFVAWDDGRTIGIECGGEPFAIAEIVDHGDMADPAQLVADQGRVVLALNCHDDMLEALKDALMVLQSAAAADPTWTQAAMARDDVSAAIAKATDR